ncbi:hypothetical protein EX30DRAFT_397532 [Ascodesmis nigricans]|uniref:C2H2-type domain-containing protein n=1 Tax=Ascodesmis nigricans TaxID=341454 RepID=A0A4S2MP33_9PEZI|nr:hypothetical protein EX30DRAFT_397532 [Ascodesmis nigricans]
MSFDTRAPTGNDDRRMDGLLEEVGPYGEVRGRWKDGNEYASESTQHTQQPAIVERSKMSSYSWGDNTPYRDFRNFPSASGPKPLHRSGVSPIGEARRTRAQLKPSNFTDEMRELLKKSHKLLINDDADSKGDTHKRERSKRPQSRAPKLTKSSKPKKPVTIPNPDQDTDMKEPVAFSSMDWNGNRSPRSGNSTKRPEEDYSMRDDLCPLQTNSPTTNPLQGQQIPTTVVIEPPAEPSEPSFLQVPVRPGGSRRGSTDTDASLPWSTDADISFGETDEEDAIPPPLANPLGLQKSKTAILRHNIRQRGGVNNSSSGGGGGKSSMSHHPIENNYRISRTHRRGNSNGPNGNGEDDEGDERRKRPRKDDERNRRGSDSEPGKRFACPYYRYDPTHPDHMRCKEKSFPTLARVKGHVLRSHLKPRQCERCCNFRAGDRGQISQHLKNGNCEKGNFVPMDPEVERKGNELSRAGCSKTWEQVCMVLFDCDLDDVPPPYFEDPAQQALEPAMKSNINMAANDPLSSLATSQTFQAMFQEHLTVVLSRILPGIMAEEMPRLIARYRELESNHRQQPQAQLAPNSHLSPPQGPLPPTPPASFENSNAPIANLDVNALFAEVFSSRSPFSPPRTFQYPSPATSCPPLSTTSTPAPVSSNIDFTDPFGQNHHFQLDPQTQMRSFFDHNHASPLAIPQTQTPGATIPTPGGHDTTTASGAALGTPHTVAGASPSGNDIEAWVNQDYELVDYDGAVILSGSDDGADGDMFWSVTGNMGGINRMQ